MNKTVILVAMLAVLCFLGSSVYAGETVRSETQKRLETVERRSNEAANSNNIDAAAIKSGSGIDSKSPDTTPPVNIYEPILLDKNPERKLGTSSPATMEHQTEPENKSKEQIRDFLTAFIKVLEDRARPLQAGLDKMNATIAKIAKVLAAAIEKSNSKAESVAIEARAKATTARDTYSRSLKIVATSTENARRLLDRVEIESAGSAVMYYEGNLRIQRKGEAVWRGPEEEGVTLVGPGDKINTGHDGRVKVVLSDGGAEADIGPDTLFELTEPADPADLGVRYILYKGKIYISKFMHEKSFTVNTQYASAAVRGTRFSMSEREGVGTEFVVFKGSVEVQDNEQLKKVTVDEGHRTFIPEGGVPADPEKVDLDSIERWWD